MKFDRSPANDANVYSHGRWHVYAYDEGHIVECVHYCPKLYQGDVEGFGYVDRHVRCLSGECERIDDMVEDEHHEFVWECDTCQSRAPESVRVLIGWAKLP